MFLFSKSPSNFVMTPTPSLVLASQQHLDQKHQSIELREGGEGTLHTPALCQSLYLLLCPAFSTSPHQKCRAVFLTTTISFSPWGNLHAASTAVTHTAQSSFSGLLAMLGVALLLLQPW